MIIPTIREVKLKRPKVAAAVTSLRKDLNIDYQLNNISTWKNGAEDAIVVTNAKFTEKEGLIRSFTKTESPAISEMLKRVEAKLGADHAIMLLAPTAIITGGTQAIFDYAQANKLQRSWAGYFLDACDNPIGFIFTGSIPKYLTQDLINPSKEDLTMDDLNWAHEVLNWIQVSVPNQRKFNATGFGIVSHCEDLHSKEPDPVALEEPVPAFTPDQEKELLKSGLNTIKKGKKKK